MIGIRIDGEVARLTLARPEVRNAIPLAGWDAIAACIDEAVGSSARAIVLAGEGGAFCAGADLGEFPSFAGEEAAATGFRLAMRRAFDAIEAAPVPVIALIEGSCYGAGVALAMACDFRLASPAARFAITPARMGISYPQEDVARLVALVEPGQAARLLFGAGAIGAEEAKGIGLVDGEAGELDAMVATLLANDRESLATLKRGIRLAVRGVRSDAGQDRLFDRLLADPALAARLEGRRRR
ncbi:MAG TPA: enoyl-CoA hydratase/isomerase family protein [Allosphingosinicella sp.]|nr:enoyl-CoA hydratase/isomerase family protein [Allosphingosinicella sp.]